MNWSMILMECVVLCVLFTVNESTGTDQAAVTNPMTRKKRPGVVA